VELPYRYIQFLFVFYSPQSLIAIFFPQIDGFLLNEIMNGNHDMEYIMETFIIEKETKQVELFKNIKRLKPTKKLKLKKIRIQIFFYQINQPNPVTSLKKKHL
jgi:hypothetical protein